MDRYLITIIILVFVFLINDSSKPEIKLLSWNKCYNDNAGTKLFRQVLSDNGYSETRYHDWGIYLSCDNKLTNESIKNIKVKDPRQIISFLHNNHLISSKQMLWTTLVNYYGREHTSTIVPPSYLMLNDENEFKKSYKPNKTYILKSEKQRQEGLRITNNFKEIINCRKSPNNYVIVQEYLKNSFTYNNYRVNFRIYMIIVSDPNNKNAYMFDDGIISYPKEKINSNVNHKNGIASFYSSKELYDDNYPITLKRLQYETSKYGVQWTRIMKLFMVKLQELLKASLSKMGNYKYRYPVKSFQLFGVDFFLDKTTFDAKILEVNMGPGMTPYREEDKIMRLKLHNNILKLITTNNIDDTGFTKVV